MAAYGVFTGSGTGFVGSVDIFTRRGFSRRDTGGVSSSAWGGHFSHAFIGSGGGGGGILDIFARGGCPSRVSIGTGTDGVGSATWGGHSSHVFIGSGGYAAAAATSSRGGGIPAAVPTATTSAAAVTSSRGGGIPAAVPAAEVTGGTHVSGIGVGAPVVVGAAPTPPASDPSVGAGAATGEFLATEQEQLVTSGGRREVLAEVSQMAGGTSPVGPGALSVTSPAPPGLPDMVHDGGAGGRWQGQRVTPVVTKSRAKRDGLWPGMFALMATQEDIARSIAELSPPDVVEQELPSKLACDMETPETYVQAHTGPHSDIWTEAEGK